MNTRKSLKVDAMIWVLLLVMAAMIAFVLLERDKNRNFGAVAFGGFPQFKLNTTDGDYLDVPRMKSRVWAVHTARHDEKALNVAKRLAIVEQLTTSGKRHLNILTVLSSEHSTLKPVIPFHYIVTGDLLTVSKIFSFSPSIDENSVVIVDQNAVIRGIYNIDNVDDYRKFQQDLMRIL